VFFETDNIFTLDNDGELRLTIMAALAQEESRKISSRVQFGLRKSANSGIWKNSPPFGYDKINKHLVINQQEAAIVLEIFQKYYSGWGIGKITRYLNSNDIPTKNTNSIKKILWSQTTVSYKLKNSIYVGKICQHKRQMTDPILKIIEDVPEDDWIVKTDETIRIIDNDLFNLVQEEMKKRNELFGKIKVTMSEPDEDGNRVRGKTEVIGRKGRYSNIHIFSNLLYCRNCGVAMKRKKRHAYKRRDGSSNAKKLGYEWVCTYQDMYGKKKCDTLWRTKVTEEYLIKDLTEQIRNLLCERGSQLDMFFKSYLEFKLDDNLIVKLPDIEGEISKLKKRIDNLLNMRSDSEISKEEYGMKRDEAENLLTPLLKDKDTILNLVRERKLVKIKQKELKEFITNSDLNNLTNELLRKIIKKIYIEVDHAVHLYDEEAVILPIFNYGIDITFKEIMEFGERQFKKDAREETREKRMCKGKIYKVNKGIVRNYKKHSIIINDSLQVIIDDEVKIPRLKKIEYDLFE